jgi:hypothetical protein
LAASVGGWRLEVGGSLHILATILNGRNSKESNLRSIIIFVILIQKKKPRFSAGLFILYA